MRNKLVSTAIAGCLGLSSLAGCEPGVTESGSADDAGAAYSEEIEKGLPGGVVYQAESYTAQSGCSRATDKSGYTGSGFIDYGGDGTWVEWNNINVSTAGNYTLAFRYANGSANPRQSAIYANGSNRGNVVFAQTGSWTTWSTATFGVPLKAGNNTVRVLANTSIGGPNLDSMEVAPQDGGGGGSIKPVFVVTFENHDANSIYGNKSRAPYINGTLMANYAYSSNFVDTLPSLASEPHYILMEAGRNAFSDYTFTSDSSPSASNSTASPNHLVTQIKNARNGATWRSYQEGLNSSTGACPIASSGFYAPKHNPFVFFQDVAGNPPSKTNSYCADHHKPMTALANDLANGTVAAYNFVTPNLCNDMHGASGCPSTNPITLGDTWLRNNLPAMIDYVNAKGGVIFLVWDEGEGAPAIPFLAIGPKVKKGYRGNVKYTHASLVKSLEKLLGLPTLSAVEGANDFADLFLSGGFPN